MALIDGTWMREGERVRGAQVARIDARGVLLLHANGRRDRLWFAAADALTAPVQLNPSRSSR
jgi:hypothetical protein